MFAGLFTLSFPSSFSPSLTNVPCLSSPCFHIPFHLLIFFLLLLSVSPYLAAFLSLLSSLSTALLPFTTPLPPVLLLFLPSESLLYTPLQISQSSFSFHLCSFCSPHTSSTTLTPPFYHYFAHHLKIKQ